MKKRLIILACCIFLLMIIGIICRYNRPDTLLNNKNEDERTVAPLTADGQTYLSELDKECLNSKYILEVEATGNYEYVKRELVQEVKFVKMIKGKSDLKKNVSKVYVAGGGEDEGPDGSESVESEDTSESEESSEDEEFSEDEEDGAGFTACEIGQVGMPFINYMKKGDHYVVFASDIVHDKHFDNDIICTNIDVPTMNYINISKNHSYVYETNDMYTKYKNLKDSEFFSNDKKTLKKMLTCKKKILDKLKVKRKY